MSLFLGGRRFLVFRLLAVLLRLNRAGSLDGTDALPCDGANLFFLIENGFLGFMIDSVVQGGRLC